MQFSVVVEGAVDGKVPAEESLAELQRYLRSTSSPQQLVQRLNSGKPFIIKRSLGYEQAVVLSDRLFRFGLETVIDPPIKPEQNKPSAAQTKKQVNGRTIKARTESTATIKAKPGPQTTKRTPDSPRNIATKSANKVVSIVTPSPASGRTAQVPTTPAAPANYLAKAAAEIKSLFRGPQKQPLSMPVSKAAQLRLLAACCLSALLPIAYFTALISVVGLMMAVAIVGINLFSGLPFFMPLLLLPLPTFMLFTIALVLAMPLFTANSQRSSTIALQAKDEPKLFMLTAALAKLVQTSAPTQIHIVAEPVLRCRHQYTVKDFVAFRKPLPSTNTITIGTSVLHSLSLKTFCALAAVELARYADPTAQRRYAIGHAIIDFLSRAKQPATTLSKLLRHVQQHITSQKLCGGLGRVIHLLCWVEAAIEGYFCWAERLANKLVNATIHETQQLQAQLVGTKTASRTATTYKQLGQAYQQSVEQLILKNTQHRYVDSLADLVEQQFRTIGKKAMAGQATDDDGIIAIDQPMRGLVNNISTYNRTATAEFYGHHGLDMSTLDVYSVEDLYHKKAEDTRLRKVSDHYYGKWFDSNLRWKLPSESALRELNQQTVIDRLNQCIGKIRYLSPDRTNGAATYAKIVKQIVELKAARKVAASGNEFKFQHCTDLSSDLEREINTRLERLKVLKHDLQQQNTAMGERIALGLQLEQKRKNLAMSVFNSLVYFDSVGDKLNVLMQDTEELGHLLQFTPKKLSRNYELHIKELAERIEESIRSVIKRAQHCPFQYLNKRYSKLAELLSHNISATFTGSPAQRLVNKSKILQKSIARAYQGVSDVAADIGAEMERKFEIEKIKRV